MRTSAALCDPLSPSYSVSKPLLLPNFSVLLFSVTVRTTLSGTPAAMSASISKIIFTLEPTSPTRWVITSSAILLASRPTRAGSSTTVPW